MAGDWIKMRGNLWDDPRVAALCDACDCGEAQVVGALYWLWATADQHTEDGLMPGLTLRQIDRKTGVAGFGAALVAIGWIAESDGGVTLSRFDEHNGASAKRRCTEAQRKANVRTVSASDADKSQTDAGQIPPDCGAREEKEKSSSLRSEEARAAPALGQSFLESQGVKPSHAADWLKVRKTKRAPLTQTAWDGLVAEAGKAGITAAEAVRWCAERSWQSFKAEWIAKVIPMAGAPPITVPSNAAERTAAERDATLAPLTAEEKAAADAIRRQVVAKVLKPTGATT
ncbi:hypothetical protein [Roseateles sp. P5_E11]